ncbi:hypothetical protein D9758_006437 [Tetrapyrgos nigripes]|uniref:Uncharacterized protein n=1 Tax=Tetrapyrgos nigripes TaxID=182062 RepID=A0A8H5GKY9_9AGAR|nr:hypothetical protein D9758_006437 [Tetrapyrgos nigripes]
MRSYNSLLICIAALFCIATAVPAETTVTFLGVVPSEIVDLYTRSRSSTTPIATPSGESGPTTSINIAVTPIGTAKDGSETTYSLHEVISINRDPSSGDVQPYTVDDIMVNYASGYRDRASQVFDPNNPGTVTVGVLSENCTYNGDGSGVCLRTAAGQPNGTTTYTGTVLPVMTVVFNVDENGAGLGSRSVQGEELWMLMSLLAMMWMFVDFV